MKLSKLGICGIISLLSYAAMVFISPIAYPGYKWMSMAVSELSADGAPSQALAGQLNCLFGSCGLVSIMAVCVASAGISSKIMRIGIYMFAAMEWVCSAGYTMFPWDSTASGLNFQNMMHLIVTALVVLLSIVSLVMIIIGSKREGKVNSQISQSVPLQGTSRTTKKDLGDSVSSLGIWAVVCLVAMLLGAFGTNVFPKAVFGIFERLSTFSAVVFNPKSRVISTQNVIRDPRPVCRGKDRRAVLSP